MGACLVGPPGSKCSLCPPPKPTVSDYGYDFVIMLDDIDLGTTWVSTPKKENTVSVVTATKHTAEANTRRISRLERKLKNAQAGIDKVRIEVSAHTYADEPYGSLYVQVPSESEGGDGEYVSVVLNEADLLALETAIFNARKKVTEATQKKVLRVADQAAKF